MHDDGERQLLARGDGDPHHGLRKGLLGELVHAEGAYEHDTRYLKIRDYGDGLWLGEHHARRNGNLYPPHGLGPIAWYLNINHGDRFDYLVSMSSNVRGMNLDAREHLPEGHPKRLKKYINGDVNSSLIRTVNGLTIILKHDTDLPRPYSRTNLVQGTRGIVRSFPEFQVCLEGEDHQPHVGARLEITWPSTSTPSGSGPLSGPLGSPAPPAGSRPRSRPSFSRTPA